MTVSYMLPSPLMGRLSDRYGAPMILAAGLFTHAGIMLAYLPFRSPVWLIALRAIEGITIVTLLVISGFGKARKKR